MICPDFVLWGKKKIKQKIRQKSLDFFVWFVYLFGFFPNSQINKIPLSFLARRHAQINQNKQVILSQGWDTDSLLIR